MAEPVSLAEAKQHLRVVVVDDDDLIGHLITAARQMVEQRTGRALVPREEVLALNFWGHCINLRWPPLVNVTEIEYTDPDGATQVLDPSNYRVNVFTEPARITRALGATWPTAVSEEAAIRIKYTVGYETPADVPAPLKQWMLLAIGALYDSRESFVTGTIVSPLPVDFLGLLWQPYMVYS